jgi:hypothetical protein
VNEEEEEEEEEGLFRRRRRRKGCRFKRYSKAAGIQDRHSTGAAPAQSHASDAAGVGRFKSTHRA